MCAYFYVQMYQVKKITSTTLKRLYEPYRAYIAHYRSNGMVQLNGDFIEKIGGIKSESKID